MSDKDTIYWDSIARTHNKYHLHEKISLYKRNQHISLINKWIPELAGARVLKTDLYEEAFGNDYFTDWIVSEGADVSAIDVSGVIAEKARSRMKVKGISIDIRSADVRHTPFESGSFDLIISNSTLDNILTNRIDLALSELHRILKDDGVLILTLDNAHNPFYAAGYYINKFLNPNSYFQSGCFSRSKAVHLSVSAGFNVSDKTSIVHIITPYNRIAMLLKKLNPYISDKITDFMINSVFSKISDLFGIYTGWFLALKLKKKTL